MPAEQWGTRPKAVKQVTHWVHSQWLNLQDAGKSAGSHRRAPGPVLGAAVGRVTLGTAPALSPAPLEGRGSWGGHSCSSCPGSSSAFVLLLPWAFCCLCPLPTISWETHSSSRAFGGGRWKPPGIVRAGVGAVWDHSGLCKGSAWVCNLGLQKLYLQNCKISWYEIFVIFSHLWFLV